MGLPHFSFRTFAVWSKTSLILQSAGSVLIFCLNAFTPARSNPLYGAGVVIQIAWEELVVMVAQRGTRPQIANAGQVDHQKDVHSVTAA